MSGAGLVALATVGAGAVAWLVLRLVVDLAAAMRVVLRSAPHEHEWSPPRAHVVVATRDGERLRALCRCQDCLSCGETVALEALEPWRPA